MLKTNGDFIDIFPSSIQARRDIRERHVKYEKSERRFKDRTI